MAIKLNGTNTEASPAFTGDDTDTGLQCGTNELSLVTGGTKAVTVDSSQHLLVGTTSATNNLRLDQKLAVVSTGTSNLGGAAFVSYAGESTDVGSFIDLSRSRGASEGSFTAVNNGDSLGWLIFRGTDGSQFVNAAYVKGVVDGTPGANDMPGRMEFYTTAKNGSATERMRIDSTGAITQATQPILKTNGSTTYGSAGSLTSSPASAIVQAGAQFERGDNGWTTTGSNAYTFVCPVDGIYAVFANVSYGDIAQGIRVVWVMGYTLGGGNLPLSNYVEVLDHTVADYMNESYYELWSFTAGTRVGMGLNGVSGSQPGYNIGWGIHLVA